jgi:iron complex outermembrane receptor protein
MMKKIITLSFIYFTLNGLAQTALGQNVISGAVKSTSENKKLSGATVYVVELNRGAITDEEGKYTIGNLPAGQYIVQVSFVGFGTVSREVRVEGQVTADFEIQESRVQLNEVIVTGVGSEVDRRKSPINVEVLEGDQLLEKASTNAIDAMSKLPGVSAMTSGQSISKPFIRGLGYNRVLTMVDGVPLIDQAWFDEFGIEADPNSVSRYEVLKGPGSLAYGSDAIGGVVNLIPEKPLPEGQSRGEVLLNYQTNNGLIGNTINLAGTNKGISWGTRVSYTAAHAYQNKYDGYVINSQFNNFNANARVGIHRSWGYSALRATYFDLKTGIVDGTRDSLSGTMMRQVSYPDLNGGDPTYVIPTKQEQTSYQPFTINQRIQHTKLIWDNGLAIGKGRLNAIFSWQRNQRQESNDPTIPNTANIYYYSNGATYDLKYHAPVVNGLKVVGGVNGVYQNSQSLGTLLLIPNYEFFQLGGYVIADKEIGKLNLSGGIRYTTRSFTGKDHYVDSTTQAPTAAGAANAFHEFVGFKSTFSGLAFSAGAAYQFNDKFYMKANVARGWRAPNVSEAAANGVHDGTVVYEVGDPSLKPETSLETDLTFGVNTPNVSVQLDLFNNSMSNFIYAKGLKGKDGLDSINNSLHAAGLGEAPVYKFTQGDARLYGGEASFSYHPVNSRWFELNASASFVDGGLNNAPDSIKYLPFVPPTRLTADVKFNFKSGDVLKNAFFRFGVQDYSQQSHVYRQFALYSGLNTPNTQYEYHAANSATAGYVLFNASFGTDLASQGRTICKLFLTCNNIFDTAYIDYMSRFKYNPVNYTTGRVGVFNMGRNFSVKLIIPINFK